MIRPPPIYDPVTSRFIPRNKNETEEADKKEVQKISKITPFAFSVMDLQFFREIIKQINTRHKDFINRLINKI